MVVKYSHSKVKTNKGSEWVFTRGRRASLEKARAVHSALVKAGKRVLGRN